MTDSDCLHCHVIQLMMDRVDSGAEPSQIFFEVLGALANFAALNNNPRGREQMVQGAIEELPSLVEELLADGIGQRVMQ